MKKKCELYYIAYYTGYNIVQSMTGVLTVFYSAGFERNIVLLEIKNIGSWAGMGGEQTDWFLGV